MNTNGQRVCRTNPRWGVNLHWSDLKSSNYCYCPQDLWEPSPTTCTVPKKTVGSGNKRSETSKRVCSGTKTVKTYTKGIIKRNSPVSGKCKSEFDSSLQTLQFWPTDQHDQNKKGIISLIKCEFLMRNFIRVDFSRMNNERPFVDGITYRLIMTGPLTQS